MSAQTNAQAPVDVKAVLTPRKDRVIPASAFRRDVSGAGHHCTVEVWFTGDPRDTALVDARDLDEVRAAMAELIEDMKGVSESLCELEVQARNAANASSLGGVGDLSALQRMFGRLATALEIRQQEIAAALALIGESNNG